MKLVLRFVTALVLTGPVFVGLSRIDPLARWVGSERAWSALTALFHLLGAAGTEGEENVLLGVLLLVSFVIAAVITWGAVPKIWRIGVFSERVIGRYVGRDGFAPWLKRQPYVRRQMYPVQCCPRR
jgi:hypothetical protein